MKKALTIGELLITLSIIGILATLVLPGFIKDYNKKIYVSKLKKVVEMLDVAINQACIDNNVSYFYQTPYVVYASGGGNQQAFIDKYFKKASGTNELPFASQYTSINPKSGGTLDTFSTGSLASSHGWAKLATGESISMYCGKTSEHCIFRIDVNSKIGPNKGGRDLFALFVKKDSNKLFEYGNVDECVTSANGFGCYGKLVEDNWEMKY